MGVNMMLSLMIQVLGTQAKRDGVQDVALKELATRYAPEDSQLRALKKVCRYLRQNIR